MEKAKLINRAERLAFMDIAADEGPANFVRMTGFTTMTGSKNPKEYSRQYVDMSTESSDVVGYAPATEYSFDRHSGNAVHEKLAKITDEELTGTDTYVDVVVVDTFDTDKQGNALARKRTYSVVPDSEGDGTDALIYAGSLKAVSEIEVGYAKTEDGWKTANYTAGERPGVIL